MNSIRKWFENLAAATRAQFVPVRQQPPVHCGNINALLLHLCDFDYELHGWVLRWLAYPLRNPGAKMDRGLVINGSEGTGKGLFFTHVMAALYGDDARYIKERNLHSTFIPWAVDARFVVVDGFMSRRDAPVFKFFVASPTVTIRQQFQTNREVPNQMNLVFLSGSDYFLPMELSNRRFVVIEAPPKREPRFYRAVADEINNGGVEVFRHYLMHELDMEGFDHRTKPRSDRASLQAEAA